MIEFVERPDKFAARPSVIGALRETARNGKAIVGNTSAIQGCYTALKRGGYKLHTSRHDAPEGMSFAWTTLIEDEVTQ